jgi:hypothetical protein
MCSHCYSFCDCVTTVPSHNTLHGVLLPMINTYSHELYPVMAHPVAIPCVCMITNLVYCGILRIFCTNLHKVVHNTYSLVSHNLQS